MYCSYDRATLICNDYSAKTGAVSVEKECGVKMKNLLATIALVLACIVGCSGEPEKIVATAKTPEEEGEKLKTIVALGDSLTAGFGVRLEESYPALLEKKLQANGHLYRVINAGVSGETRSGTLARLE